MPMSKVALANANSVEAFSNHLRDYYRAEAEQRRQERIAFGKALEKRQNEDIKKRQQLIEAEIRREELDKKLPEIIEWQERHAFGDGKNKAMQALGKLGGRPRKRK